MGNAVGVANTICVVNCKLGKFDASHLETLHLQLVKDLPREQGCLPNLRKFYSSVIFSLGLGCSFSLPPWRTGRSPASTRRPEISSRPGRCARRQLWYFDVIHHQWSLITEISMVTLSRRSINFDEFTQSAFEDSERRQKGQVYLRLPQILSWSNLCPNQKFFWDHKEGVPKMQKIYFIYPAPHSPHYGTFSIFE